MTLDEYQSLAARTINGDLCKEDQIIHALHGMAAEVGELHGIHQKAFQGHRLDGEHMKKEIGDIMWFLAEYCTAQGWGMSEVGKMNIDKLKARYPEGFEAERSLHRKEGDI